MDSQQMIPKNMRLKRKIHAKTCEQINALEDVYSEHRSPSDSLMEELVLRTELTRKDIVEWFANKRSKAKHGYLLEEVRKMSVNFCPLQQNTTHPHPSISSPKEDGSCRDPLPPSSSRNHLPLGTTVQEQSPIQQQDEVSVKVPDVNVENNIMPGSLNGEDSEIEHNLQASDVNIENNIMAGFLNYTEDIPVVYPDIQDIHVIPHQSGVKVIYEYQFFPEKPIPKFEMPEDILHSHYHHSSSVFDSNNITLPLAQDNFYENRGMMSEYAVPVQMPIFAAPYQQGYDPTQPLYSTNYATGIHFPTFPKFEKDDICPPSGETSAYDAHTILERRFKREEDFLVTDANSMMWRESEGEERMIKMLKEMEERSRVQHLFPVILQPGAPSDLQTSKQMDPAVVVKADLHFESMLASKVYNGGEYSTSSRGDKSSAEKDRAAHTDTNNGRIRSGSLENNSVMELEEKGGSHGETSNTEASGESKATDTKAAVEKKQEGEDKN